MYTTEHHTTAGVSYINWPNRAAADGAAADMTKERGGRCAVHAAGGDLVSIYWGGDLVWADNVIGYRTADGRAVAK